MILSDSEDDQRVPDNVEKAAPEAEAVGLPSDAKAESLGQWPAAASARLQSGYQLVLLGFINQFAV